METPDSIKPPYRSSGVLLHPTSLPGNYGVGDLGYEAYHWIDSLAHAQQGWWQILPLTPTSYGDSPYQCFSAFAGNPTLISPDLLVEEGLLNRSDIPLNTFSRDRVDYGPVIEFKARLLGTAWHNFCNGKGHNLRSALDEFNYENRSWLDDYALFRAIKDSLDGQSWLEWPQDLLRRQPAALQDAHHRLQDRVGYHKFTQFLFFRQWAELKEYARERNIQILGDAPIFVAGDSSDVWANPHLFLLDENRRPKVVAGVPPDYFSATGQLWGNPLYDWEALEKTGFQWWTDRLRVTLKTVDLIRIDHFRGFQAYWEIPASNKTAEVGKWVEAPGDKLFTVLSQQFATLPLVAEDLGIITPKVDALREKFGLPGMRVLQFAFGGGSDNSYLPHNYAHNTVVYTGTHDNNTTRGWYDLAPEKEKDHVRRYLGRDGSDIAWDLIRTAWASVAKLAVAPLQDILEMGNEARMNFPGHPQGNWSWRFPRDRITPALLDRLAEITELFGRS